MSRIQRRLLNGLVMFLCGAVTALPQGGATGAISGTVQDTSGGVIPGAEVRIVDNQIGTLVRTLKTSPDGVFTATLLPVGVYKVSVNANGFTQADFPGVEVRVTETTRMIATLNPQQIKQEVEVNAQVETVEAASAATGQSVTANTIGNLPLATQNFQQLLTLSAGAASSLNSSASLGRGDAEIEVNGGRQDNNNYLIEGISASDFNQGVLTNTPLPSPDVVQEFKVSTSLYDATQGRNGGGNINAILKSGTADFHFDVFEFFRNTALNANNFFLNSEDQARPDIKQNIFGGSAGGPLGGKGKLGYFFTNYQGTRQRSGESPGTIISTIIPVLPSDRSPQSLSQAFFGNTSTALDPVAVKLLNIQSNQFGGAGGGWLIPSLPQTPGLGPGQARLIISTPGQFTDNQFTVNWDREFRNSKDRVSARFFYSNSQSDLPFGGGELNQTFGAPPVPSDLGFPFLLPLHDRFLSLSETHLFTATTVNELRLGYNRINSQQQNVPIVTAADLGIDRPDSNQTPDIYRFVFPNYQIGPSPTQPVVGIQNVYALLDTLSYVRGAHDVKFGGEIDNMRLGKDFLQADNGEVFFTPLPNGLDDFQNFLIGNPIYGFAGGGVGNHNYRLNDFSLFVQDDYRATRNLTLNLGLRTEIVGAAHDLFNHIANTDPTLALAGQQPYVYPTGVNQLNVPGLVGNATSCTLRNCYSTNWNPRVGLAYDLAGHHTTSIRAGYGIYSIREDFGAVDNLSFSPPFLPIPVPAGVPGTLGTLFAVGPGQIPPAGVISPAFVPVRSQLTGFVDSNGNPTTDTTQTPVFSGNVINFFGLEVPRWWIVPNTQQWNFTVQRALGSSWIVEAGYVGTKGTHLRETSDADQAQFATPQHPVTVTAANGTKYVITQNTLANANARAPYLGLAPSAFEVFADDADSTYNSLQVTVTHRFSQGLYLLSAYTWSKSIDDTSTSNTAFDTRYNDQTNGRATRGLSDFDHSQRWITTYVYDLPFFAHAHSLAARALGGWQLSGIITLQSGTPFTVIDSGGGTTYAESSPNLVTASLAPGMTYADGLTAGSLESRLSHYVNINAFQLAPVVGPDGSTGFGNLGRNIYRGPKQFNWDLSLGKNFRLTERQSLWFRADFFNFTNTPSFASPSFTDVESPSSFGAITSTVGTPRLIQFSAKYSF